MLGVWGWLSGSKSSYVEGKPCIDLSIAKSGHDRNFKYKNITIPNIIGHILGLSTDSKAELHEHKLRVGVSGLIVRVEVRVRLIMLTVC